MNVSKVCRFSLRTISLFILAALQSNGSSAQSNPNGASYGLALSVCATRAIPIYDDGTLSATDVAAKAVGSCTTEIAAMRGAMRQIIARYAANSNSPAADRIIDQHMAKNLAVARSVIADEVTRRRKSTTYAPNK